MRCAQVTLVVACEKLSLPTTGGKQELAERLVQYYDRDSNIDLLPIKLMKIVLVIVLVIVVVVVVLTLIHM